MLGGALITLAVGSSADGVANAMTPNTPYVSGGLARAQVTVTQTANYNGSPCVGSSYLYSRGILEGKGSIAFGTVAVTAWACRTQGYSHYPAGCVNVGPVLYHSKGNWRNENATNTTNVSGNISLTCSP